MVVLFLRRHVSIIHGILVHKFTTNDIVYQHSLG